MTFVRFAHSSIAARCSPGEMKLSPFRPATRLTRTYPSAVFKFTTSRSTVHFGRLEDTTKGNRPSFSGAARPERAEHVYERFCAALRGLGVPIETGVFGAKMEVELVNDGPVTIVLE